MTFESPLLRFLLGIILIVLLDTIGANASNKWDFEYIKLILFSLAIYVFTGFILGKITNYWTTLLYSALLGLFDGTIGLKLSIYFNANMGLDENQIGKLHSTRTYLMMIVIGLIFGSIGFAIN